MKDPFRLLSIIKRWILEKPPPARDPRILNPNHSLGWNISEGLRPNRGRTPRVDEFEELWADGVPWHAYEHGELELEQGDPYDPKFAPPRITSEGFNIEDETCPKCGLICSCLVDDYEVWRDQTP
jgi:hypothetical protein